MEESLRETREIRSNRSGSTYVDATTLSRNQLSTAHEEEYFLYNVCVCLFHNSKSRNPTMDDPFSQHKNSLTAPLNPDYLT